MLKFGDWADLCLLGQWEVGGSLILMDKSRQYFIRGLIPPGTSIDGNEKATISKG